VPEWPWRPASAGSGESLLRHLMHKLGLLLKVGEELAEFSLDALAHAAQHDSDERRQRQLAATAKRVSSIDMAGLVTKLR